MGKKHDYSFFKVTTFTKVDNNLIEQTTYSNLSYKQALSKFKEVRLKLESENLLEYIYLSMEGITTEGESILKNHREFLSNSVNENTIDNHHEVELINETEECLDENYSTYIDNNENIPIGEIINSDLADKLKKSLAIKEEDKFDNTNKKDLKITSNTVKLTQGVSLNNNLQTVSHKENNETSQLLKINNISSKPVSDFMPKKSTKTTTLKDLKLTDYYRHISEVSSSDIIDILVQALSLLDEKNQYNQDMTFLADKKRDCSYHDFEDILFNKTLTEEERDSALLTVSKAMAATSVKRRQFKVESSATETAFSKITKVRPGDKGSFNRLKSNSYIYTDKKKNTTQIYTYTYTSEEERIALKEKLKTVHSKVIDVEWGVLECYNRCGTGKQAIDDTEIAAIKSSAYLDSALGKKPLSDIVVKGKVLHFPHIFEFDSEEASIAEEMISENNIVNFGTSFNKEKGSSVKISGIKEQIFKNFVATIHHKYTKIGYDKDTCSAYLLKRI